MTILVFFDSFASTWEIQGEIGGTIGSGPQGVPVLLQRSAGDCPTAYLVKVEIDEQAADSALERIRGLVAQHAGYVSNVKIMSYRSA